MVEPKLFYCTFGSGQVYENHVQPILAYSIQEAEKVMFQVYGKEWGFSYTERHWENWKNERLTTERELDLLDARKVLLSDYAR